VNFSATAKSKHVGLGEAVAWKRMRGPFEACLLSLPGRALPAFENEEILESVQVVARQVSAFSRALDGLIMAIEG